MSRTIVVAGLVCLSTSLGAQAAPAANPMSQSLQRTFNSVADFVVKAAELFPEDKYGFRATPETRSFGDEIAHIADAHFLFCSRARNEASPQQQKIEGNVRDKAQLVAKLKESVSYCNSAYEGITDAMLPQPFQVGNARGIRLAPLVNNAAHTNESYGKVVTLLRLNGVVPPSTTPR